MRVVFLSPVPYRVLRIFLGVLFLASGLAKSMDLVFFSKTIQAFAIIPGSLCLPAAVMIVLAEIVFGGGLVLDIRFCLGGILVLVLGFMVVVGHAIHMGYDIDCGCFGPGDPEASAFRGLYTALYRDMALLVVAGYLFLWRHKTGHRPVPLWFNKKN
ncbi:MAG: DoxX family protein [Proteobacteria bacterium]|nr:DoxX family protein [Pseudomonadota bacterium]MBU4133085.1 DoxX family protein [Pseudomonadota bacterium]